MSDDRDNLLDRLLRDDARRRLPDEGFTLRVGQALPPRRLRPAWLRPVLVIGSAAVGGVAAWLLAPAGTSLAQGYVDLARLQSLTPSALSALGVAAAMALTAVVLVVEEN
ncbi:MAG: hypothetical protein IPH30_18065 [Betaproteobacteria bacterium]|nr:hypothetical protein [Betaproteobacteria bacterium]